VCNSAECFIIHQYFTNNRRKAKGAQRIYYEDAISESSSRLLCDCARYLKHRFFNRSRDGQASGSSRPDFGHWRGYGNWFDDD
jgi:adenine-specific DNA methylase